MKYFYLDVLFMQHTKTANVIDLSLYNKNKQRLLAVQSRCVFVKVECSVFKFVVTVNL